LSTEPTKSQQRSRRRYKSHPGSVFKRGAANTWYVKYKGQCVATGLPATPANRKLAEVILMEMYRRYHGLPSALHVTEQDQAPVEGLSVRKAREEYERYLRMQDKSERTIVAYMDAIKKMLPDTLVITPMAVELNVEKWIERHRAKYTPASINIFLRNLGTFVHWMRKRKILSEDVDLAQYKRKGDKKHVVVYDDDTCAKLIEHFQIEAAKGGTRGPVYREFALLLRFLLATGARIGEALRLKRTDMRNGAFELRNKTSADPEYIPVSRDVEAILNLLPTDRDKLFRWTDTSTHHLRTLLAEGFEAIGAKRHGGFHVFRKTFQDRLQRAGVDMADRQKLMRHKNIRVTIEHYTYSDNDRLRKILDDRTSP
jgi:integrase